MNQTLKDIEIILIDDGSTDRSGELADYFQEQDSRIKVVHQENKGLSATRNIGLDMAQGTYIAFVDSDDWIVKNALERLVYEAKLVHADMVLGTAVYCYENGTRKIKQKIDSTLRNRTFEGKECFIILTETDGFTPMACCYLYSRNFIEENQSRFEPILFEDEFWTINALCQANVVRVVDFNFYAYRQRKNSIVHSAPPEQQIESLFFIANRLFERLQDIDFYDNIRLKSWKYTHVYRLYYSATKLFSDVTTPDFVIPANYIAQYHDVKENLLEVPKQLCFSFFTRIAENYIEMEKRILSSEL